MLADYHVHTGYSDDSNYPLEQVVKDAIKLNLDEICITDHVDYGVKSDWDKPATARFEDGHAVTNVAYPAYFAEMADVRDRYADRIVVKCGLEFGVQSHTEDDFNRVYDLWGDSMDFSLLSIHQVGDLEFWSGDFQRDRTQQEYNDAYYEEMLKVVTTFDRWSVLAHLDLIKRYDPAGIYPFEKSRDVIAAILEETIKRGNGIEVNTSSFRYGLPDLQPCTQILELYRDLGGRIITIGSDSHQPSHLGAYIRHVQKRLLALGITEFCTFDKWEPTFHRIEA